MIYSHNMCLVHFQVVHSMQLRLVNKVRLIDMIEMNREIHRTPQNVMKYRSRSFTIGLYCIMHHIFMKNDTQIIILLS